MKTRISDVLEKGRIKNELFEAQTPFSPTGFFVAKFKESYLQIISSNGEGWSESGFPAPVFEHVSVTATDPYGPRMPTWDEMCFVKDLFWEDEECVLQYHPPKSVYVNVHPLVLHLWKPLGVDIPTPPMKTIA